MPTGDVERYGRELSAFLRSQHNEILEEISSTGKLGDDLKVKLDAALDAFGAVFEPTR